MYKIGFWTCLCHFERSVPLIEDGPSQYKDVFHALKDLDDGRHKVANVVGHSMKYHPHREYLRCYGSIGKRILLDLQGNWGNTLASELQLDTLINYPFALEVVYNAKTAIHTILWWERKNCRFTCQIPIIISCVRYAVGLSTKILPPNTMN